MDLQTLVVSFGANLTALSTGVTGAKALVAGFGLAAIGAGAMAVKMAADFQSGVTALHTGAGELTSNLAMVSQGMLNLATQTGTSTKQLSDGMYLIESAGYHGAAGLQVLQAAAQGAKVGNADLATVANGVTTVMTDYASSGITAANATNDLIATVASGKTTLADLSASMASVLPTASATKVGLYDVSGAMATMTGEGVPAADAATYLRQMLMSLDNPSKQAKSVLADIGLTSQQVASDMQKSLPDTLAMIEDHLGKKFPVGSSQYMAALAAISGGTKQMQGMLDLTGSHLQTFEGNVSSISEAVKKGGANIQGWSDVQQDFNFKMQQAQASLEVLGITIGSKLLPVIGPLVANVANVVSGFTSWLNSGHAVTDALSLTGNKAQIALPILAGLGALVLSVLVPAFVAWAGATIAATWPILAIVAGVAGLTAGFVALYQHVAPFRQFIDNLVAGFKQVASYIAANFIPTMQTIGAFLQANVLPILQQIGNFVVSTFTPVWQQLVNLWQSQLMPLFQQLWGAIQPALPALKMLGEIIAGVVVLGFIELIGVITGVISAVATIVSDIASAIAGVVQIITGVVQVITGIVRVIYDIITGNFKDLGPALGSIWQGILNTFGGAFQVIGSLVHAVFGGILSFIGGFINGILGIFTGFKVSVGSIWNSITSAIGNAFSAIGTTVHNILTGIGTGIGNFFSGLGTIVHNGLTAVLNFFTGAFNTIGGWFTWLYNHNTYIKDLCDGIKIAFQTVITWLQNAWATVTGWLASQWNRLKELASIAWNAVMAVVQAVVNNVTGWLRGQWNSLVNTVGNIWNGLKGFAQTAWNNVSGVFSGAWGKISGILNGLWNNISKSFANIATQALQWGKNIIQGIIDGINNMLGSLGNAASNAAAQVAKFLGFHSPAKEGPGRELDQWPRNMMKSYATGIEAAIPMLQHSLNLVMQPVASSLSNGGSLGMPSSIATSQQAPVLHNHVYLDGRELTDQLGSHIVQKWLAQGPVLSV